MVGYMPFREIEHTADAGMEVWAGNLEELFLDAAQGLLHFSLNMPLAPGATGFRFTLDANDYNDLLVAFLSEVNFYLTVRGRALWPIHIVAISGGDAGCRIECASGDISIPDARLLREIKSVTYHQLDITVRNGIYHTKIIFDL
jgi:SHS2 domain-containing protein